MSTARRHVAAPSAMMIAAVIAWAATGCQLLSVTEMKPPTSVDSVPSDDLKQVLDGGQWVVDRSGSLPADDFDAPRADGFYRWRFVPKKSENADPSALERRFAWVTRRDADSAALSAEARSQLTRVAGDSTETAWTAAILLSRLSADPSDSGRLHELVCTASSKGDTASTKLPTGLQAAAIETWCRALARLEGDPEINFSPAGRRLEQASLSDELRGELFRGIARRIAPRQIPGLNDVMVRSESEKTASPLHLAAMEACLIHAENRREFDPNGSFQADDWPDGMSGCRFSDDTLLRKLYGRWAASARHPDAVAILKSQRLDNDLGVREAAVLSLGLIEDETARRELLSVLSKGTDPERVAAIQCLVVTDADEILRCARDESPRVRTAVARALRRYPSSSAALALAEMLGDRVIEVQLAALNAAASPDWKEAGRVSLLLQALRVGGLNARQAAISQLRDEWGREPAFPLEGTPDERDSAVRELAQEHGVSAEVFTAFAGMDGAQPQAKSDRGRAEDVRRWVRESLSSATDQSALARLVEMADSWDAAAAAVIEDEVRSAAGPRVERIYRDVLPRCHPGYAALLALDDPDANRRRRAAHRLREFAAERSLSPTLVRRLAQRMTFEQDRAVWQEVLEAILPDAFPEAAQLALVSLNSAWPDIRQLGCDYFERHPQPEYAEWLLPRLDDADRQIRIRAVHILGQCGNPVALDGFPHAESGGLRQFLTQPDAQLRWEAVVAMTRLGDPQAAQELIRQTYDPQPKAREAAIAAIGAAGQSELSEPLLRRLWTETDPTVQSALLKSLDHLVPVDVRPGLAADSSISDKIKEWARWWEQQPRNRSARDVPRPAPSGRPASRVSNTDGIGHDERT